MFVVLQIEHKRHSGFPRRILDMLRRGRIAYEQHQVMGARYYILRWSGGPPDESGWAEMEDICRRSYNGALIPQGLVIPGGVRFAPPLLPRFERRVLCETACEIARMSKQAGVPLYRRVLGIADPGGELAQMLPSLLRYYSCVKVHTDNFELYLTESERMMRELGAPVLVGCELESLDDCMLILAREQSPLKPSPNVPVLCPAGFPGGSPCVTSLQIRPPDEIAAACPPDIPLQAFAGSLYEFCGIGSNKDISFAAAAMFCDYRRVGIAEAVRLILSKINA
jgi:hypothetical protein